MLVLTRRIGEEIVIGEQIRLVVAAIQGDHVRLGICAPATVRVDRQEVHERRSLLSGSQRPGVEEACS
jgi:carbon storage regulator